MSGKHTGLLNHKTKQENTVSALLAVKRLFDSHRIFFWLDCGTLLGAVRDGRMIKWDDDMDFGLTVQNFLKIPAILNELGSLGYDAVFNPVKLSFSVTHPEIYPLNFDAIRFTGNYAWKLWLSKRRYQMRSFGLNCLEKLANLANLRTSKTPFSVFPRKFRLFVASLTMKVLVKMGCFVPRVVPRHHLDSLGIIYFYGATFFVPSSVENYLSCCYGDWRNPRDGWDFFVDANENRPELLHVLLNE